MGKRILVTDFDDTLAQTDANVIVKKASGKTVVMDPAEYAVYDSQAGDSFDFSQFDQLINPRPIQRFVKLLKHALAGKADRVVVLTARGHTRPVAQFLKMHGITKNVAIAALGDSNPEKKAQYIEKQIQNGYDRVAFIDDSPKNVAAVSKLKTKYPNIRLLVHQAKDYPEDTVSDTTPTKNSSVQKLMNSTVKNPETGNDILVKTALKYSKNHPSYKQAKGMVTAYAKRHASNVKPTRESLQEAVYVRRSKR